MLQGQIYVPFVFTKGAELKALAKLDRAPRANTFPIIAIRPGPHKDFNRTVESVKESLGNLRFGLELDRNKFSKCKLLPARQQFDSLFEENEGFESYYKFCEAWGKNAIPVLRVSRGLFSNVPAQKRHIIALDRGIIVRVEKDHTLGLVPLLDSGILNDVDHMFVVDASWSDDILQAEMWVQTTVDAIFARYPASEIACISSSYPKDFSPIKGQGVFSNDDRELFDRVRRRHNEARLTYGDWASTRTSVEKITNKPRPRIDVPTPREWVCFRLGDKEEGGFEAVAKRVVQAKVWLETPDCWGKRMIDLTAHDLPGRIDTDHKSQVSRIQLHMTIQAMGGFILDLPDEPYVDKF